MMTRNDVLNKVIEFANQLSEDGSNATDIAFAMDIYVTSAKVLIGINNGADNGLIKMVLDKQKDRQ